MTRRSHQSLACRFIGRLLNSPTHPNLPLRTIWGRTPIVDSLGANRGSRKGDVQVAWVKSATRRPDDVAQRVLGSDASPDLSRLGHREHPRASRDMRADGPMSTRHTVVAACKSAERLVPPKAVEDALSFETRTLRRIVVLGSVRGEMP